MNRKHISISVWVSVLLLAPAFLFALPGDSRVSQPAHDQPLAVDDVEDATAFAEPIASAPHIVQYFEAYSVTSGVALAWSAISERDIRGFSIYRRDPDSYEFLLVNQNGLIGPWQKAYTDGGVQPKATYQYVLSVVHTDGSEVLSHPAEVTTRHTRPKRRSR